MKIFRITIEEASGTWADIKNLKKTLAELKEIYKLKEEDVEKEKREELKKTQQDIKEMKIEIADAEYKGMLEVEDFLTAESKEEETRYIETIFKTLSI